MSLFRWRCWMRAIWYAITNPPTLRGPFAGAFISGHDYIATEDMGVPAFVDVLRCEDCGDVNVGWRRSLAVSSPANGKAVREAEMLREYASVIRQRPNLAFMAKDLGRASERLAAVERLVADMAPSYHATHAITDGRVISRAECQMDLCKRSADALFRVSETHKTTEGE